MGAGHPHPGAHPQPLLEIEPFDLCRWVCNSLFEDTVDEVIHILTPKLGLCRCTPCNEAESDLLFGEFARVLKHKPYIQENASK